MKRVGKQRFESIHTPAETTRKAQPKVLQTKDGHRQLICPFCIPPHPLYPGQVAPCGTVVQILAIQRIVPRRIADKRNLECLKCHKLAGGDMVPFGEGFVHLQDCMPEVALLAEHPPFEPQAEKVFRAKDGWWKRWMIKRHGEPQEVKDIATQKVLGYFFLKA